MAKSHKWVPAKAPYKGYRLYKVYHKKENRWFAVLVHPKGHRTSVAWAKYLLEVKVGEKLGKKIHAHHSDGVRTHDVLSNIEKLPYAKHNAQHARTYRKWCNVGRCAFCRMPIVKVYRGVLPLKPNKYIYCCKQCSSIVRRKPHLRRSSKTVLRLVYFD